ncbi:MAG: VWA domain-containing protein [Herpetosiphonaceae bacterium]|nr:VWA domain-containing protein [Herpetosiphonaceae bacterium]
MSFIWPAMLALLLLLPVLVVLYLEVNGRRRQRLASYGRPGAGQATARRNVRDRIPPILFLAGLAILIVALARPQTAISLPHIEGTVILAFDVSGSMAADDLKPTRMEAAKAAVRDFVQREPSTVQIGVVGFSDSGFAMQAPTNDQATILEAINRLTPQRGTSLAHGIQASLNAISAGSDEEAAIGSNSTPTPTPTPVPKGTYTSAVIVLLSDGENNESPNPVAAAQTATDRGVRIYTVGIGSAAGTTLHINGFTVHTQLDEATLQQISQLTGGTYYNAQSEQSLRTIYDHLDPQLRIKPEQTEVTALFAGVGFLVLLIGSACSLWWFSRVP